MRLTCFLTNNIQNKSEFHVALNTLLSLINFMQLVVFILNQIIG